MFKSQFKWVFTKVVITRAGRLREWWQGELQLYLLLYFFCYAPSALGELIIGSRTEGFALQEGCTRHQELDYCFTLTTPGRDYVVMATTENERKMWMDCLSKVIAQPMTDEDKQG